MKRIIIISSILLSLVQTTVVQAQSAQEEYVTGTIQSVELVNTLDTTAKEQRITVQLQGNDEQLVQIDHLVVNNRPDMQYAKGERVVLHIITYPSGEVIRSIREVYRIPSLLWLIVLFFIATFLVGGVTGLRSVLGLVCSIAVLIFFVVPLLLRGINPLLVSIVGSALIAASSIYVAHGFNRRTSVALISTVVTLLIAICITVVSVQVAKLFGLGTEESVFLQASAGQAINMKGLLLAGIIIGTLGVLDDITTAQTAAIDELSKANHALGAKQLYAAGASIGKEHIASLINTLALAYFGSSLPLFLLLISGAATPWWVTINSEFLAEEVVRTLVGSAALLFAVPISTWIAAVTFAYGKHTNATGGHSH